MMHLRSYQEQIQAALIRTTTMCHGYNIEFSLEKIECIENKSLLFLATHHQKNQCPPKREQMFLTRPRWMTQGFFIWIETMLLIELPFYFPISILNGAFSISAPCKGRFSIAIFLSMCTQFLSMWHSLILLNDSYNYHGMLNYSSF